jgi:hypothetical protein
MMSRTIVAVMTVALMIVAADTGCIRVAHNNFQSSIDWSEHEARGNESTQTQQSENERSNPTGRATASRSIWLRDLHSMTMPDRLGGIK